MSAATGKGVIHAGKFMSVLHLSFRGGGRSDILILCAVLVTFFNLYYSQETQHPAGSTDKET